MVFSFVEVNPSNTIVSIDSSNIELSYNEILRENLSFDTAKKGP